MDAAVLVVPGVRVFEVVAFHRVQRDPEILLVQLDEALVQADRIARHHVVVDQAVVDQQRVCEVLRVFDRRGDPVRLGVELRGVEDVRGVAVVVTGPVGRRPLRRARGEFTGRAQQRHLGHETAVGTAVDADARGIDVVVLHQPGLAVQQVLQFRVAHAAVNRVAPVAAVAGRGAIVHVDHDVAFLQQQVVEHLLAEVIRPVLLHVLQVAGAVHEDHRRVQARGVVVGRLVVLRPDPEVAVARRHLDELGLHELLGVGLVLRGARIGELAHAAAIAVHHRELRRHVGTRMQHGELAAIRREREVVHAFEVRHLLHGATRDRHAIHVVVVGRLLVGVEVEPLAVGRHHRARYFIAGAGQRARLAVQRLHEQLRPTRCFRLEPQRGVVGQPAEFIEAPVDPGRIGEPVLRHQLVIGEIDGHDPAVLVVVGDQFHRKVVAIRTPCERGIARFERHLEVDRHRTRLGRRERGGFGGMAFLLQLRDALGAQVMQGVVVDAGQAIRRQRVLLVVLQVQQDKRLGRGAVAADIGARGLRFGVAGFVDVVDDVRALAALVGLRHRHHQQPARVGRQRSHHHPYLVAEVERRRCAVRVLGIELVGMFAHGILVGLVGAQGREQAELQAFQLVGLGVGRVVFGLQGRGLRYHAGGGIPDEPFIALAPTHQLAVGGNLQAGLAGVVAGDLAGRAIGDFAHVHVTMTQERRAIVRVVEHGRAIGRGQFGIAQFHLCASGGIDAIEFPDRRARALEFEVDRATVHAPIRVLDRRPDPVGVGHDLLQRDAGGRGRRRRTRLCLRCFGECARADQQAGQSCDDDSIHGSVPREKREG